MGVLETWSPVGGRIQHHIGWFSLPTVWSTLLLFCSGGRALVADRIRPIQNEPGSYSWWWGARSSSQRLKDDFPDRVSLRCHGEKIIRPYTRIQTWAGSAWCRWIDQVVQRYSIYQREMSWRWSLSQQLKVSIIPGGEHQGSEDELSVVQELDAECPRSHELPGWILSVFPFLVCLYQCIIVRYLE
jgi:hypothetical protein